VTTRKLIPVNGNLALVIDSGVLQILDIDETTELKLSTDGDCLVMTPIRAKGRKRRFHQAVEAVVRDYDAMLKEMVE
jgi:antitoxin component of MazEF toxin-antitoxin module